MKVSPTLKSILMFNELFFYSQSLDLCPFLESVGSSFSHMNFTLELDQFKIFALLTNYLETIYLSFAEGINIHSEMSSVGGGIMRNDCFMVSHWCKLWEMWLYLIFHSR